MYLQPYIEGKERKRISGIRGNLIRYKYITKEKSNEMNDQAILLMANKLESFSHSDGLASRLGIARKGKESKRDKGKEIKEIKDNIVDSESVKPFSGFQSSKSDKPQKHKHGEYKHVMLTDAEYESLSGKVDNREQSIKNLDEYLETSNKKYKNHSLVMQNWDKKNKPESEYEGPGVFINNDSPISDIIDQEYKELYGE